MVQVQTVCYIAGSYMVGVRIVLHLCRVVDVDFGCSCQAGEHV